MHDRRAALFGAPIRRTEDPRLLRGHGRYVGDLDPPGLLEVAFVRSPHAHARVLGYETSAASASPGVGLVLPGDDPAVAKVRLRAVSELPGYRPTEQPILAWPTARFAGEAVAAVVAADRYAAEDAAELVRVAYEPLRPVVTAETALADGAPAVHAEVPDNVLIRRRFQAGDVEVALSTAHLVVERRFTTNRQAGQPLEGRGALAAWDPGQRRLTLYSSTQVPHLIRRGLADVLGLPEGQIRVVAPDVGGGFGVKATLYPEEVAVCLLAMRIGRPVRWLEDRRESLLASAHARDHRYRITAGFDAAGRLLALRAHIACNVGAYSVYPWTAGIEPLMAGGLLMGPYKLANYDCETLGVATTTAPAGPYRGVARPATTFAMERVLDVAAAALGLDPVDLRRRNLVGPADLPYTSATRLVHDSEAYPACLEATVEAIDYKAFRAEQARGRAEGRHLGIGFACYNELTGLGRAASAGPRMPFRTGHEGVTIRIDPSGSVSVLAGVTSQGQGLETTVAQLVAAELGASFEAVRVRMGDTDVSLFGFGAFSSRQAVIGGGAAILAARALRDKVLRIGAHLLEVEPEAVEIADGRIFLRDAPGAASHATTLAEVATVAYLQPQRLPPDLEAGLEATRFYDPVFGTFAGGAQAAVVEVLPETGQVRLLRFVCAEDSGRPINPSIVEGQMQGAIAQGIGGVLYEHLVYDEAGQLLTASLMDYLLPASTEIPPLELRHLAFPSPTTLEGIRGVGEGGTLGPAAAIANAVSDALSGLGIEVNDLPITPDCLRRALGRVSGEP